MQNIISMHSRFHNAVVRIDTCIACSSCEFLVLSVGNVLLGAYALVRLGQTKVDDEQLYMVCGCEDTCHCKLNTSLGRHTLHVHCTHACTVCVQICAILFVCKAYTP